VEAGYSGILAQADCLGILVLEKYSDTLPVLCWDTLPVSCWDTVVVVVPSAGVAAAARVPWWDNTAAELVGRLTWDRAGFVG